MGKDRMCDTCRSEIPEWKINPNGQQDVSCQHSSVELDLTREIASLQAQLAEKEEKIQQLIALIRGTRSLPFYKDITEEQIRKVMEG